MPTPVPSSNLLKIGQHKEVAVEFIERASEIEYAWLSDLAEPVRKILESGKRLAQEHVGWEFLRARTGDD
jgi:hypothetical protein